MQNQKRHIIPDNRKSINNKKSNGNTQTNPTKQQETIRTRMFFA